MWRKVDRTSRRVEPAREPKRLSILHRKGILRRNRRARSHHPIIGIYTLPSGPSHLTMTHILLRETSRYTACQRDCITTPSSFSRCAHRTCSRGCYCVQVRARPISLAHSNPARIPVLSSAISRHFPCHPLHMRRINLQQRRRRQLP